MRVRGRFDFDVLMWVPDVQYLEQVLEQAKAAGMREGDLITNAEKSLVALRKDFHRCAGKRLERLGKFQRCRPMLSACSLLFDAACHGQHQTTSSDDGAADDVKASATAGTISQASFMDLHLGMTRAGCLNPQEVGSVSSQFPFCYASPHYVRYLDGQWPSGGTEEMELPAHEGAGSSASDLAPWDDGVLLWRLLQHVGLVRNGRVSFEAFVQIAFELVDAHVVVSQLGIDKSDGPTDTSQVLVGAQAYTPLQAYLNVLTRIVHGTVLLEPTRLRHTWPRPDSGVATTAVPRKLSVPHAAILYNSSLQQQFDVRQGLACHKGITRAAITAEWRKYRGVLGLGRSGKLTFGQLDRAFRRMEDKYHKRLCYRFALNACTIEGVVDEIRQRARWADADETLCFLRWLDRDGDGMLSQRDFCSALLADGDDDIPMLGIGKKWVALKNLRMVERSLAISRLVGSSVGGNGGV